MKSLIKNPFFYVFIFVPLATINSISFFKVLDYLFLGEEIPSSVIPTFVISSAFMIAFFGLIYGLFIYKNTVKPIDTAKMPSLREFLRSGFTFKPTEADKEARELFGAIVRNETDKEFWKKLQKWLSAKNDQTKPKNFVQAVRFELQRYEN